MEYSDFIDDIINKIMAIKGKNSVEMEILEWKNLTKAYIRINRKYMFCNF